VDEATGRCLLPEVRAAERFLSRLLGLMGRKALPPGTGLYFPRCSSVHMFFMRFPVDVVYFRGGVVKKIVRALGPWRISWCPGADGVLEAPAGWAQAVSLRPGMRVRLERWAEVPA